MILSYKNLQDRVLDWIDESDDTGHTLDLVKDAINASHRRVLTAKQWSFMAWPQEESITTAAGTDYYSLNPNTNRIYHLWDVTNRVYVPVVPRREWPGVGVDLTNTSTAPYGVILGPHWPVQNQPASAGTISIVSSSASDVTSRTVVLKGIDTSGVLRSETLTATGVTTVTGSISFAAITNVTKTGTWVGTLTITRGATTLLTLLAADTGLLYPTVKFLETPDSARVFTYEVQRQPTVLSLDNDIPETPYPFSEIHVYDTLLDLTTYNTELGPKEQSVWKKRYDELWDALCNTYDEEIVGAYPKFVRDLDQSPSRRVVLTA